MNEIEMLRRFRHGPRTGSKDRLGQRHHLVGILYAGVRRPWQYRGMHVCGSAVAFVSQAWAPASCRQHHGRQGSAFRAHGCEQLAAKFGVVMASRRVSSVYRCWA